MRRLTYSVACSVDGSIAGPGAIDSMVMSDVTGAILAETVSASA